MHLSILPLLALAFNALSIPVTEISDADSLLKRALTPDATCGGANKYTCQGSQYGNCCSSAGYWQVFFLQSKILSDHYEISLIRI